MTIETDAPQEDLLHTDVATKQMDDIHPVSRYFLFLGKESTKRNFIYVPLVGMILMIILGVFHPQKHPLPGEQYIPGSWAIYGFIAYSLIVLSANTLFKFLGRNEDYYGEGGLPDPEVSTDPMVTGVHHD